MSVTIRVATVADADAIGALAAEFQAYLRSVGDRTPLYHWGYDTDRSWRLLYVVDLYVHPAYRRRGIGAALMRQATERCRAAGGQELVWSVYAANTAALRLYEQVGARYVKELTFMYWPVSAE